MKRLIALAAAVLLALAGTALSTTTASAEDAPNGYPYCENGSASDPDGDGWGWENEESCVVRGGPADGGSGGEGGTDACPSGMECGSYTISGLGNRKQQILNAGADTLDLAIAMLETDNMDTNYPYGDNKSNDAANFGIFKQNWYMLRNACSQFQGQSTSQWNNGAALNSNLGQDISCLNQSQNHYGMNTWFGGHRNGETGINNPDTSDINGYKSAIYWIRDQLNSGNLSNDTRFWVQVQPI